MYHEQKNILLNPLGRTSMFPPTNKMIYAQPANTCIYYTTLNGCKLLSQLKSVESSMDLQTPSWNYNPYTVDIFPTLGSKYSTSSQSFPWKMSQCSKKERFSTVRILRINIFKKSKTRISWTGSFMITNSMNANHLLGINGVKLASAQTLHIMNPPFRLVSHSVR